MRFNLSLNESLLTFSSLRKLGEAEAPSKNAWHKPFNGGKAHYHDSRGLPVCGKGWSSGKATDYPEGEKSPEQCSACHSMTQGTHSFLPGKKVT